MTFLPTTPVLAGITSSVVSAVLSAIARAISSGITSLAAWAIGGLAHAAVATTAVDLNSWFQGPWRAMLTVAALVALPLFLVGTLESLVHGEGVAGLGRVVGRLALAGLGSAIALGLVQLLLSLVDVSCEIVEQTSGISIGSALARLGTALGVTTVVGGGGAAAIGGLLLALLAALAALTLWLELAMRTVLILVSTAFLPLGLSGLLWPKTASWLRRLGEILTAIAISKLVIVVVLVLGAAALTNSTISLTTPGADIDAMVNGVAFLGLATLGLPIALRVVPFAAEAAMSAGRGGTMLMRSGLAASRFASAANSTSTLLHRARGGSGGTDGATGGTTPGSNGPHGPNTSGPSASGPTTKGPNTNGPKSNGPGPKDSGSGSAGQAGTTPTSPKGAGNSSGSSSRGTNESGRSSSASSPTPTTTPSSSPHRSTDISSRPLATPGPRTTRPSVPASPHNTPSTTSTRPPAPPKGTLS